MKESVEDFIRKNRPAFDYGMPREGVWHRIESSLSIRGWWHPVSLWRAAAVLLLGVSILLYIVPGRPGQQAASIRTEFADLEEFYIHQITEKVSLISAMDETIVQDDFTQDLQRLDAMYDVLRNEMERRPNPEGRDALVLNLLVRIDLLNRQLKDLEDNSETAREI